MTNPKRIAQIAYDQALMFTRAVLLERKGFEVISLLGNGEAKHVLVPRGNYDLFIVGHSAPAKDRLELTKWLRRRYPKVKILALNPSHYPRLEGAHLNVEVDEPEKWLAAITYLLETTPAECPVCGVNQIRPIERQKLSEAHTDYKEPEVFAFRCAVGHVFTRSSAGS